MTKKNERPTVEDEIEKQKRIEQYLEGKIKSFHPNIFTIETNKGLKSFTYSDIATNSVIISKI